MFVKIGQNHVHEKQQQIPLKEILELLRSMIIKDNHVIKGMAYKFSIYFNGFLD